MEGKEFVQSNAAPAGVLAKTEAGTFAVLQKVLLATAFTVTGGLTVIVKVSAVPGQPFKAGVAEKFPETAIVNVLVAVEEAIFPVPAAGIPIEAAEFIHPTVAGGLLIKLTAVIGSPGQTVWLATGLKTGTGFTVMV